MNRKLITFSRVIKTGMVNFVRNAWLAIAAMAVMVVTLTIVLFSLIANATFGNTIDQITSKIDVSVYLKDGVTPGQTQTLIADIKALPNVEHVTYVSKEEVLQKYLKDNQSNSDLLSAMSQTDNPLPAQSVSSRVTSTNSMTSKLTLTRKMLPICNPTSLRTPVTVKKPSIKLRMPPIFCSG